MIPIESSTISRSATSKTDTGRNKLLNGKQNKLDTLFPLFDQFITNVKFPNFVLMIFEAFVTIQLILSMLWPMSTAFWRQDLSKDRYLSIVKVIFFFIDYADYNKYITICTYICLATTVLILLFLAFQIWYYNNKRSFLKWSLYVSKIIAELILPCLVLPIGYYVGTSFVLLYYQPTGSNWAHFIIGVISLLLYAALLFIAMSLTCHSVIISKTIFPSFDANPLLQLLIASCLTTIFSFVLSIFPKWMELVVPIFHSIWIGISMTSVATLPLHDLLHNTIILSIYIEGFVADLTTILFFFVDYKFKWAPLIIDIAVFLISCATFYFIIKRSKKVIKRQLNNIDFNTDEEAIDYYTSLGLSNSTIKALKYLYNGIGQCCDGIVDMKYIKFLYTIYTSNKLLIKTLQALTFFPTETRAVNALFRVIVKRRDLKYAERFTIYQINRVKSLRASSSSDTTNNLIIELKDINAQVEANIRNFWSMENVKYIYAEELSKEINLAEIHWKEAIEEYPNNDKISQEYSRFLAECKCDFEAAIYQHQITEMIENGHNFAVDSSYRSFIRTFPKYLTNEILDLKGKRVNKDKKEKNTETNSLKSRNAGSSSGGLSSSSSYTLDAEMEEAIGKKIMRNSRMRLALHHSIDDKKSNLNKWMHASGVIMIFIGLFAYLFVFIYMDGQFKLRSDSVVCMDHITVSRFNGYMMFNTMILNYGHLNNRIGNETEIIGDVADIDSNFHSFWNLTGNYGYMTMYYAQKVKSAVTEFFKELAELSAIAVDVYTLSGAILNEDTTISYCNNSKLLKNVPSTIRNKVIFSLYQGAMTTGGGFIKDMFHTNVFCETLLNFYGLPSDFGPVFELFNEKQIKEGQSLDKLLNRYIVSVPIAIALISFVPIFIINIVFVHKFNSLLSIFEGLDQEAKEDAKIPISLDATPSNQTYNLNGEKKVSRQCWIIIIIALLTTVQSLLMYFYLKTLMNYNDEIIDLGTWFTHASDRLCAIAESFCDALMVTLMNETNVNFISREQNVGWVSVDTKTMTNANDCLLRGCDGVKTSFGYDKEIDIIHFQERCEIGEGVGTLHDVYGCSSINQQISVFMDIIQEIASNPSITENGFYGEKTMNIYHITSSHLLDAASSVIKIIENRIEGMHDIVMKKSSIFLVCGLLIAVIEFFVFEYYIHIISSSYQILLILVKHLHPTQLLASKKLMDFILNRKSKEDDRAMGTAQSIIHSTGDAILCTGLNGIVEISNPAVTNLLGYTPDQILGQHINNFISEESQEIVTKQMVIMQNGQSSSTYEDHITCISDSSAEIDFYMTIIGMKSEGSSMISSFVFLLTDETELLRQQKEAEEAKAQSEKLLYQILPKDIVVRLNRGEKDITFTVPSSTIIFIDIVKFSEYSSSLTPQEIMGNLSVVFATFDTLLAKYTVITKIKLIGDVYMAAAGLFLPNDADPQQHAEEMVRFGIDCVNELEDINMKLNASLEVRVGINTGGPLIAGVLGTDKPTFDIIGDPINVASRLQSTDIPGKIQISRATFEIISQLGFNVEERGEVFLKGKGKQMTYIVHPQVTFMGQSGSITSTIDIPQSGMVAPNI